MVNARVCGDASMECGGSTPLCLAAQTVRHIQDERLNGAQSEIKLSHSKKVYKTGTKSSRTFTASLLRLATVR